MAGSLAKQMMDQKKNRRGKGPSMDDYRQLYMNDEQYFAEFRAKYPNASAPPMQQPPMESADTFSQMDGYSDYNPTSHERFETGADHPESEYEYFREEQDYVPTEYSDSDYEISSGGQNKSPKLLPRDQGIHPVTSPKSRSQGRCFSRRWVKIFFSFQAMVVLLLAAGVAYCYFTDTKAQELGSFLTRSKQDALVDSGSSQSESDGVDISEQNSSVDPYAAQGSSRKFFTALDENDDLFLSCR